jgi:hypothetical protein
METYGDKEWTFYHFGMYALRYQRSSALLP